MISNLKKFAAYSGICHDIEGYTIDKKKNKIFNIIFMCNICVKLEIKKTFFKKLHTVQIFFKDCYNYATSCNC